MVNIHKLVLLLVFSLFFVTPVCARQTTSGFSQEVHGWALECRREVTNQLNLLLTSGKLSVPQLFDTFYIPIPKTMPQKYRTQYDILVDGAIRPIIDKYRNKDKRLRAVYILDKNGYAPTHNSYFSQPLVGDSNVNLARSRTKRLFTDRASLEAARDKEPYLLRIYETDAGRSMVSLSVPLEIQERHWGAVRFVFKPE